MSPSQSERHAAFQALHRRPGAFVIPNPWDAGTARILTALGFEALATTSAGYAFATGRPDTPAALRRDEVLDNARNIVEATHLPVSADLQQGFGTAPEIVAETIAMAIEVGLVGGSIEDASGDPEAPIFPLDLAVARVAAACAAARGRPFVVTARAENFLYGRPDLADTIARLQAFAAAGAEVVYAPGLPDLEAVRRVCAAVEVPVNVVVGLQGPGFTVEMLEAAGVKRISVGSTFARAALGAMCRAAREIQDHGTFGFADDAASFAEITAFMTR